MLFFFTNFRIRNEKLELWSVEVLGMGLLFLEMRHRSRQCDFHACHVKFWFGSETIESSPVLSPSTRVLILFFYAKI